MKFSVKTNEPALRLGRILGYKLLGESNSEYNFVRSLGGNRYPRFHIYVKVEKGELIFNLHLDQKKPSYGGQTAHSGEYDGELVEKRSGEDQEGVRDEIGCLRKVILEKPRSARSCGSPPFALGLATPRFARRPCSLGLRDIFLKQLFGD